MRNYIILKEALEILWNNQTLRDIKVSISAMTDCNPKSKLHERVAIYKCDLIPSNLEKSRDNIKHFFGDNWEYIPIIELKIGHSNLLRELRVDMTLGTLEDINTNNKENEK